MRPIHPVPAIIGIIVAVLVAVYLSPVFPAPLSTIVYWAGWIVALVLLVLGAWWLTSRSWGPRA